VLLKKHAKFEVISVESPGVTVHSSTPGGYFKLAHVNRAFGLWGK